MPEDISAFETRFKFLFGTKTPRYQLHAPDLCDLMWSVWDTQGKRTIARGSTAEIAVDSAIAQTPSV